MFANGTEYMVFLESYCFDCGRYKADKEGIPIQSSCKIEKAIFGASVDRAMFPKDKVFQPDKRYSNFICTDFISKEDHNRQRKRANRKPIENQISLGVINEVYRKWNKE